MDSSQIKSMSIDTNGSLKIGNRIWGLWSGSGPRIFIYRGKSKQPAVVGFSMRNDLDAALDKLKEKLT